MSILHGGQLDQLKPLFPEVSNWIDLSTGISPWPYPVDVHDQLTALPTQSELKALETAIAEVYRTEPNFVLAVPGLEAVIRLLPLILDGPLHIQMPSYGDYELSWQLNNSPIVSEFPDKTVEVICQPNNPTGTQFVRQTLEHRIQTAEARNGWLVVDESYLDASDAVSALNTRQSNRLIVLKSFGKFFGLPGLRLGAVIMNREVGAKLERFLGTWRVSTAALSIGRVAYLDFPWQIKHKKRLKAAMATQNAMLDSLGLMSIGGTDLFQCIQSPEAENLWQHLMKSGIYTP